MLNIKNKGTVHGCRLYSSRLKRQKQERFMGSSFEDLDKKELIQELRSISKMLQLLHSSLGKL